MLRISIFVKLTVKKLKHFKYNKFKIFKNIVTPSNKQHN